MALTSLAKQLQALSVPHTSRLSKEHAVSSLLFQPKQAAELERDDIFILALNGLEELEGLVPAYSLFRSTIFSEESKYMERSVKSKAENQKLDREISAFLRLLSPFFMLKPAQKALEWLVRRFQIHLYNIDDLMKCALAFHESKAFARVVQILDLSLANNSRWRWLTPFQKNGLALAKSILINRCCNDMGFLDLICQLTKEAVQYSELSTNLNRTTVLFYMSTVLGVLNKCKAVSEELLTLLTPYLVFGFKSTNRDLVSASYFILVYINQRVQLEQSWLEPILLTVLQDVPAGLEREAVGCFAVCFANEQMDSISSACSKLLMNHKNREALLSLATTKSMMSVFVQLMNWSVKVAVKGSKKRFKDIKWLLNNIKMTDLGIITFLRFATKTYLKLSENAPADCFKQVVDMVQRKYPAVFDSFLEAFCASESKKDVQTLFSVVGKDILNSDFSVSCGSDLVLYLNHPSAAYRKRAVECLDSSNVDDIDIESVLLARLKDDPSVVNVVLNSPKLELLSTDKLMQQLVELVSAKSAEEEWDEVCRLALGLLTGLPESESGVRTALPQISERLSDGFKSYQRSLILHLEADSSLSAFWKFWKVVGKCALEKKNFNLAESLSLILERFSESIKEMTDKEKDVVLMALVRKDDLESTEESFRNILLPLLLAEVIVNSVPTIDQLQIALRYFSNRVADAAKIKARKSKFEISRVFEARGNSEMYTLIENEWKEAKDVNVGFLNSSLVCAVKLLADRCSTTIESSGILFATFLRWTTETRLPMQNICNLIFKYYVQKCLKDSFMLLNVLQKCLGKGENSQLFTVHCLCLLKEIIRIKKCQEFHDFILSWLLPFCHSSYESVRRAALNCLPHIKGHFKELIAFLLDSQQEIENDSDCLPAVLKQFFDTDGERFQVEILNWISDEKLNDYTRLGLMSCLDTISSPLIVKRLLGVLNDLLAIASHPMTVPQHSMVEKILTHMDSPSLSTFKDTKSLMKQLTVALRHNAPQLEGLPTIQLMTLKHVKKFIYDSLFEVEYKRELIWRLLELNIDSSNVATGLAISKILRKVLTDSTEITYHLESLLNEKTTTSTLLNKSTPRSTTESRPQIVMILEAIEGKSDIIRQSLLIPVLFQILKRSLDAKDENSYELELVLGCLLEACNHLDDSAVVEQNLFNIELLIRCLQRKASPRFHGTTLLALSVVAQHYPEFVLHNAVNVFALMSSGSLLHQEDSYSFGIILATLQKVLPPIFQALLNLVDAENEVKSVSKWMRIFVNALPDILEHRRQPLLTTLLSALGTDNEWLWLLLVNILQLDVTWDVHERGSGGRKAIMAFAVEFCNQFSSPVQISAAVSICTGLIKILKRKDKSSWFHLKSDKHRRNFCHSAVTFMSTLFSSHSFLTRSIDVDDSIVASYQMLTEVVLQLLDVVKQLSKQDVDTWKQFINRCYQLLDKTIGLVPEKMLIDIVGQLLKSDDIRLQCKVVEMFSVKLQRGCGQLQFEDLQGIYKRLLAIIKNHHDEELNSSNGLVLQQLSLYCFKYLTRRFASTNIKPFQKLAKATVAMLHEASNEHILSSALLCTAELCIALGAHFIVLLNKLVPTVITLLEDEKRITKNELLLISLVTLLSKLVECQQPFLSPYLDTILYQVCHLRSLYSTTVKTPLSARLTLICRNLSRKVEPRVLLPAVKSCYERLISSSPKDVVPLMAIITESLHVSSDGVGLWHEYLSNFFFQALDYRSSCEQDETTITLVERSLFQPILALVMKMSEVSFRPFFLKFFDWGTKEGGTRERTFTFYSLTNCIAEQLKNLFVLFAGHLVLHMVTMLDSNNTSHSSAKPTFKDDKMNDKLLHYIFDILCKCFINDTVGFLNKERFQTLMTPLVDQLENDLENYEERVKHLIPCLAHLPQAVTPDVSLQPFVNHILLKTRHSSPQVRCAALESLRQVAKKLNEDFLSLLPETIPFLAELMEDDVMEVEQLCQSVIADLEEVVGEPLQKYFSA